MALRLSAPWRISFGGDAPHHLALAGVAFLACEEMEVGFRFGSSGISMLEIGPEGAWLEEEIQK